MGTLPPKTILAIGLAGGIREEHHKYTRENVKAMAAEQRERLSKMNIMLDTHLMDASLPASQHLLDVKNLLHDQAYDGVSIGFGVRGNEAFTDLFTGLVNLVVEQGKTPSKSEGKSSSPKLLFALAPDSLADSVLGIWPEYKK